MSPDRELKFRDITDGLSNTIMGLETLGEDAVKWTKPEDIRLDVASPFGALQDGIRDGFYVMLADGAVTFLSNQIKPELFKGLLTRNGAEVIQLPR